MSLYAWYSGICAFRVKPSSHSGGAFGFLIDLMIRLGLALSTELFGGSMLLCAASGCAPSDIWSNIVGWSSPACPLTCPIALFYFTALSSKFGSKSF